MSASASSSRTGNIGPFFFHIEGLPKKYTWQDLKDLIRGVASHGIWADMAIHSSGQTGGKGYARIQRSDEASNLYRYLTTHAIERRQLRIHLWDISGTEARFLRCNCDSTSVHSAQSYPAQGLEVTRMAHASGWQSVTSMSPTSPISPSQPSYVTTPTLQYVPGVMPSFGMVPQQATPVAVVQAMANLRMSPLDPKVQDPRYVAWYQQYHQQATRTQACRPPMYTVSATGTPINTTNGLVRTEARGVFVSNLSFKARSEDVRNLFGRAGKITRCELQKDSSTGKSKGVAMLNYATAAEAQRAVDNFHDKAFLGMKLRVRHDKEPTVVSKTPDQASRTTEPIIVNGSQVC